MTVTGTGGNNLTFANTASISDNRVTEVNTDGSVAVNLATTVAAGTITSLTFNALVSILNNVALPPLTINGTAVLDVLGTTFSAGTTIGITDLRDANAQTFANDITFTGNTNIAIESSQGSFTIGNTVTFSGGATERVTLEKVVGDPITITVPASQNVSDPDTSITRGFQAGTGVTLENAPEAPVTNTIRIPAPTHGRYAIRQILNGSGSPVETELVPPTDISAGVPVTHTIDDSVFTHPDDSVRIYAKYDSAIGGIVYSESEQSYLFNDDGSDINYVPQVVANVLIESAAPVSNYGVQVTADGQNVQVALANNTDVILRLTPQQTLGVLITAANDSDYFNAWYNNRDASTQPIFVYGLLLQTIVDARFVTFTSGNRPGGVPIQHQMANIVSAGFGGDLTAGTTVPEILFITSNLALVDLAVIAAAVMHLMRLCLWKTSRTMLATVHVTHC